MPIIIEANYAKKVGLPSFSSHQFAVTLRTELTDLSQLEKVNAELYARLQQAVDGQIIHAGYVPGSAGNSPAGNPSPAPHSPPPRDNSPAAGNTADEQWRCSDKQRDLILRLVEGHSLDKTAVDNLARQRFGIGVKQLNKLQASGLIDELIEDHGHAPQDGQRQRGAETGRRRNHPRPSYQERSRS